MPVTLRDVARAAGVSASAVSRSFTTGAPVSEATRDKVLAAAKVLGYQPNRLAASLTTGRTGLVGVVMDDIGHPGAPRLLDLATRGLEARGYRPILVNLRAEAARPPISLFREYAVEAVLLMSGALPLPLVRAFRDSGLPVIHAFARASARPDLPQTGINDTAAGRLAGQVLAQRGYRHVGFVGGPEALLATRDRLNGLRVMIEREGGTVTERFAAGWGVGDGRSATADLLSAGRPEAIFAADDALAIGALAALREAGLAVPGDVGLIGLGDMEAAGWAGIDLTTLAVPVEDVVAAALELLTLRLADPATMPEARTYPAPLVERGTLRPRA